MAEVLAVAVLAAEIVLMFAAWRSASRRVVAHSRKQGPRPGVNDHPGQASAVMLGVAALATTAGAAIRLGSWDVTFANLSQLLLFGVIAGGMAGHSLVLLITRGQSEADQPRWTFPAAAAVAVIGGAVSSGWVLT
ncbi:hypothetical protein [Streptomyces sp. H27-D2]|uniref:hypothetical protein n=1 Tax=Streptomyces sp. H27-D2 TaxID=3046304 RepID=UPI002DB9E5DC|nr:hypothetical protein [Streptomyces sp. H27-D2]MEC4018287.1 hypothetical protein [Streptomyces sp. H27-D2]